MFGLGKKSSFSTVQQAQDAGRMLQTISPLVNTIYSHGALFAINRGLSMMTEIFFYLVGLACIAFCFIMDSVFPFHILGEIMSKHVYEDAMTNKGELETYGIAVKALVVIIGLLFICIGMLIRNAGNRRVILQQAGKELKAIETYFTDIKNAEIKTAPDSGMKELPDTSMNSLDA